jgi:hypothetical protein
MVRCRQCGFDQPPIHFGSRRRICFDCIGPAAGESIGAKVPGPINRRVLLMHVAIEPPAVRTGAGRRRRDQAK